MHDTLTRLPNRILLEDRLDQAISKADREGSPFALMFMDLDGFKTVNDAYGHDVGDNLLVAVTQRLLLQLKGQYTLARIGGDEFVLLAETTTPDDAASLANSLVRVIDSPFHFDPYELMVTLSIGIALYPHDGKTDRELMFNADAAMYHTKHMGRNGYHFFQPSMNTLAQTHLQLMNDLWQAIDRNELRLLYQPKFHAPAGRSSDSKRCYAGSIPNRDYCPRPVSTACRENRADYSNWKLGNRRGLPPAARMAPSGPHGLVNGGESFYVAVRTAVAG